MAAVDQRADKSALLTGIKRVWQLLGPGLITGASDDDPSGIGTYSSVINGIVAVMIVMMSMTARVEVMGKFTVTGGLRWLGWTTTIAMGICVVVMGLTWVV